MDIVRTKHAEWVNGRAVIAMMEPAWRENLGPVDQLDDCYAKYNQKTLVIDPVTSFRGDLVQLDAGYADLTDAYHDSVEECFYLTGDNTLSGEQLFNGGDYFWRPPGFVHAATTDAGFTGLLFVEGVSARDRSGRASRVIRPTELAGTNAITDDLEAAVGPRGWIRARRSDLPWIAGAVYAKGQGDLAGFDLEHLEVKVLSHNPEFGGQSIELRLQPGYQQSSAGHHSEFFGAFVVEGSISVGDEYVEDYSWVAFAAGEDHPPISSAAGATLFVKVPGFLDFAEAR